MEATLPAGTVVAGRYKLESLLGEGGMGMVYAATDLHLTRPVAVKFMRPELASDEAALARFLRETRAVARLTSEHVVRIHDVGTEGNVPFMVMEHLEGCSLATLIDERGAQPIAASAMHVMQACDGIAEAHRLGIVHRDLKPLNLFLASRANGTRFIKVLDFGICKTVSRGARPAADVSLGTALGSPTYMAPEQMKSPRDVDTRADIWGLGVLLYELLTGRPPFIARSLHELMMSVVCEPALSPRALRHEIPEPLAMLVMQCLEKDPAQRLQSAEELARGLAPFAHDSREETRKVRRSGTIRVASTDSKAAFATTVVEGRRSHAPRSA